MEEFPSNSKATPPKTTPVRTTTSEERHESRVSGPIIQNEVTVKKPSIGRRAKEFFTGRNAKIAGGVVLGSVILPALRDMMSEAIRAGSNQIIYGDAGARRATGTGGIVQNNQRIMYNHMGTTTQPVAPQQQGMVPNRHSRRFDDLIFAVRTDANEVLDRMYDILSQYGEVSIKDLCVMINKQSEFTDNRWGWKNLHGSDVRRDGDGFLLVLPPVVSLD